MLPYIRRKGAWLFNGQFPVASTNWEFLPELVIKWAHILGSTLGVSQSKSSLQGMLEGSLCPCENFLLTIGPTGQEILIDLGFQPTPSWTIKWENKLSAQKVTEFWSKHHDFSRREGVWRISHQLWGLADAAQQLHQKFPVLGLEGIAH